jgi:hypothetical protein
LGKQPTLFDSHQYPSAFDEQAIKSLQRHSYPWGTLLVLAYEPSLHLDTQDSFFLVIQGKSRGSLEGHFTQLEEEAKQVVIFFSTANEMKMDILINITTSNNQIILFSSETTI